ncbi:MAG: hypothetical protein IPP49_10140 [Saprospiraceae bacterium]|nr:hypothetical protein [Saprospiraceae bacterium]
MIFLRNTGSTTSPSYSVEDKDYLRFSQFNEFTGRFAPTFGDLDDDGDDDLLVRFTRDDVLPQQYCRPW